MCLIKKKTKKNFKLKIKIPSRLQIYAGAKGLKFSHLSELYNCRVKYVFVKKKKNENCHAECLMLNIKMIYTVFPELFNRKLVLKILS